MKKIIDYLESKLKKSSQYELTSEDKLFIEKEGINKFIFQKLSSKKFRKWKLANECILKIEKAVKISITKKEPLHVVFFQGGYKLWRLPSSPEADWAEFFNFAYIIEYLSPIAKAYKYGVDLIYYIHTLLMEAHDNLTTEEINIYINSLQTLINEFNKYLPKKFKIRILKDADIYPREEYFKRLEEGVNIAKETYKTLTQEKKDNYHSMGNLNIKWKGKEDWSKLSQTERDKKIYRGVLYEMSATSNLPKVMAIVKGDDKICLFTNPSPIFIGVGSTKTSITKYWIGFGVLESEVGHFYDRVLSPKQFELAKKIEHKKIIVNLFPLKNFKEIWVYSKRFNFSKQS